MADAVFITGAAGFIAGALSERLRAEGTEVRGVDVAADPGAGTVAGDISRAGRWQEHARGAGLVIHTAAVVSNAVGLDRQWEVNVLGTRRALEAAVRVGAERFVLLSSVRAFSDLGFPDGVEESHPVRPDGNPTSTRRSPPSRSRCRRTPRGRSPSRLSARATSTARARAPGPCSRSRPCAGGGSSCRPWGAGCSPPSTSRTSSTGFCSPRGPRPAPGRCSPSPTEWESPTATSSTTTPACSAAGVPCVPTPVALALAGAVSGAERLRGNTTEVNPVAVRYLTRRGTYSIAKARRVLGYEPRVGLAEGMERTEAWLREEGLL